MFGSLALLAGWVLFAVTAAHPVAAVVLNMGAALGPWSGGLALSAGLGYRSPLWVSALFVALALALGGAALVPRRGERAAGSLFSGKRPVR
ncbi:hypothetical protein [Streptomyces alboniger]|uniref:hypothetical protein n=1 Tax=Streptomyces alboniger TaxID=132473 RepID=UPI0006E392D7